RFRATLASLTGGLAGSPRVVLRLGGNHIRGELTRLARAREPWPGPNAGPRSRITARAACRPYILLTGECMAAAEPRFRPFETLIPEESALACLRDSIAGADDGEIFLERRRSESLLFDDGRLRTASYDAAEGFGLRTVRGGTTGYSHSTEISEAALRRAAETARLAVGDGGGTLAEPPLPTNRRLYTDHDPFDDADFAAKVETLRAIDAYLRDLDPRVVQVSVSLAASMQEVEILRPEGMRFAEARPMARLNVSV